jgi:hypothetical protein
MESEGSLLHLQERATAQYPEPDESSSHPDFWFVEIHFWTVIYNFCSSSLQHLVMQLTDKFKSILLPF